jgi:hypothetical protein
MKSPKKSNQASPKRQKLPPPGTLGIIDTLLREKMDISENGVSRRVSVFEAILLQILIKELSGNKAATNLRLKFQEQFRQRNKEPMTIIIRGGLPDPPLDNDGITPDTSKSIEGKTDEQV